MRRDHKDSSGGFRPLQAGVVACGVTGSPYSVQSQRTVNARPINLRIWFGKLKNLLRESRSCRHQSLLNRRVEATDDLSCLARSNVV